MAISIRRDPRAMKKFADALDTYMIEMKALAKDLQQDVEDAQGAMQDETSRHALSGIEDFINSINLEIPHCDELKNKLQKSAQALIEAEEILTGK